jgi:hypothetical protein
MLHVGDRLDQTSNLLSAEHDGKFLRPLRIRNELYDPVLSQGLLVEESKGAHGLNQNGWRCFLLFEEEQLVVPDILGTHLPRGFSRVLEKSRDVIHVTPLRVGRVVANPKILLHPLS